MQQTGFSHSALKRNVRRLVEMGAIAFKVSPNDKSWANETQKVV
ncbi:MAG: hypothetical protein HRU30_06390 [Rhodobacteraceae bacterium]|nr:hypothetical protein [Paracoccaceae bacterium]